VLAATGFGSWQPGNDATLWVKFNLRAHHMQAQTMRRRFDEAETQWREIDNLLVDHRLNDRVGAALFDAVLGLRVTRPSYVKLTELDERTATRDLVKAAELGLLEARGRTPGAPLRSRRDVAEDPRRATRSAEASRGPLPNTHRRDPARASVGRVTRSKRKPTAALRTVFGPGAPISPLTSANASGQ
jgi:hypothetical protein